MLNTFGNLYVADTNHKVVKVYVPPYEGTPKILNDAYSPAGVAVDVNGNVAAGNLFSSEPDGPGSVSFYANGATNPTNVIGAGPDYINSSVLNVAFDAQGNLYLDGPYYDTRKFREGSGIGEIVGGIKGTRFTLLNTGNYLEVPSGIVVTTTGLIAFDDCTKAAAIYAYKPPVSNGHSLGQPVLTTPLPGSSCASFTFSPQNTLVFTAQFFSNDVSQYAYPRGGAPERTLNISGSSDGIALNPPQVPQSAAAVSPQ